MSGNAPDSSPLGPLLQYFFTDHMLSHRRASPQTVDSYRDTFRLLLRFLQQSTGKEPARLRVGDLDAPAILSFLDHVNPAMCVWLRSAPSFGLSRCGTRRASSS